MCIVGSCCRIQSFWLGSHNGATAIACIVSIQEWNHKLLHWRFFSLLIQVFFSLIDHLHRTAPANLFSFMNSAGIMPKNKITGLTKLYHITFKVFVWLVYITRGGGVFVGTVQVTPLPVSFFSVGPPLMLAGWQIGIIFQIFVQAMSQ